MRSSVQHSGLRVRRRRKKSGEERAVRCRGAGEARNWRGGAAETADGSGQRSSDEVVKRSREQECGACEGTKERRCSLGAFQC
jgi:hypothetical protein